ncbi:MAG TPA: hypothetical protein PLK08_06860 [Phycisphaerae bacterium]|nr:hypothetical protein [Phycisphaerae bacterium]
MKKAAVLGMMILATSSLVFAADAGVEKTLEINSILADAQSIYLTPAAAARAGRLVALSEFLASLNPTDVHSLRFLCEIATSRGLFDEAKKYAGSLFDAQPESYQAACRWLKFELDDRQTAPARIDFLDSVTHNTKYSAAFRSHAETLLSGLYVAQGDTARASEAISHALQLDPTSDEALLGRLALTQNPSNELKAVTMLEMLRGNPRNWSVSRDMAVLLNEIGLPELSAKYYSLAWAIASNGLAEEKMSQELAIGYCNALLSDSKPDKVISLLSKRFKDFKDTPAVMELYVEALKTSGAAASAILPILEQMKNAYKSQINQIGIRSNIDPIMDKGRKTSPELADAIIQLGIFYLTTAANPELAEGEFDRARQFGAKGDVIDMLQAAAAITIKKDDPSAVKTLTKLSTDFAYANLSLAEYYAKTGEKENEKKFLSQGLKMTRGTRVSRALRAMWSFTTPIPKIDDVDKVAAAVNGFDAQVLYMATNPNDFIKVTASAIGAPIVSPGQAMNVAVTVTNIGQLPVSFGETGVLSSQVALSVVTAGKDGLRFYTAPVVILPVDRYLAPGKSVSGDVRLDTAQISAYLANDPLTTIQLDIKPCLNPVWDAKGYVQSLLPMIEPGRMTFYRAGLLATGKLSQSGSPLVNISPEWYTRVLGAMNDTLAGDNVSDRFRTAKQIAAMLAYSRAIEGELAKPLPELRGVFRVEPIMALAEKIVQDKSPAVRAEFVASMNNISTITPNIINLIGPIFQDSSDIVRLRVAEFLGNVGGKGNMEILHMFAADKNPYVSTMAKAFLFYEKNRQEARSSAGGQPRQ